MDESTERKLDAAATAIFLTAGAVILVAEVYGVVSKKPHKDTISELLWTVRDRLPGWARFPVAGAWLAALGWLGHHIIFGGS